MYFTLLSLRNGGDIKHSKAFDLNNENRATGTACHPTTCHDGPSSEEYRFTSEKYLTLVNDKINSWNDD